MKQGSLSLIDSSTSDDIYCNRESIQFANEWSKQVGVPCSKAITSVDLFPSSGVETLWRIFKAVSFFASDFSSSGGKTSGGIVSAWDPSTDAFSEGLEVSFWVVDSIGESVTFAVADTVEVKAISCDDFSSDTGIAVADKSTVNRIFYQPLLALSVLITVIGDCSCSNYDKM